MEVSYDTDVLTERTIRIELSACTASEELFLTAMEKVLREGKRGERLTVRYRLQDGSLKQLAWLPKGKRKPK